MNAGFELNPVGVMVAGLGFFLAGNFVLIVLIELVVAALVRGVGRSPTANRGVRISGKQTIEGVPLVSCSNLPFRKTLFAVAINGTGPAGIADPSLVDHGAPPGVEAGRAGAAFRTVFP